MHFGLFILCTRYNYKNAGIFLESFTYISNIIISLWVVGAGFNKGAWYRHFPCDRSQGNSQTEIMHLGSRQ